MAVGQTREHRYDFVQAAFFWKDFVHANLCLLKKHMNINTILPLILDSDMKAKYLRKDTAVPVFTLPF